MSTITNSRDYARFDGLAEEFAARYRRGERPSLQEYVDRCPEMAAEIRELFPALVVVERAEDALEDATGLSAADHATPRLTQLGDFRILREIGRGGMGVVYEAEQVSLGRRVALKTLPTQMIRDANQRRRFEREAKAAGKLHHTNIVPVFGVGEHDGIAYYVMQFIQGLGLDEVLDELKRLHAGMKSPPDEEPVDEIKAAGGELSAANIARSLLSGRFAIAREENLGQAGETTLAATSTIEPEETVKPKPSIVISSGIAQQAAPLSPTSSSSVSILSQDQNSAGKSKAKQRTYSHGVARVGLQIAEALAYAHGEHVIHRDIKPSNLLLDTKGNIWVTDFGLAKADDQQNLTHTGDLLGTLRYMPPEAFEGKSDASGDDYSLGLTLYELLAFRPAFDEKDRGRLVKQVTTGEPPRLGKQASDVPRDLETIVHKAIDRDPIRRYASSSDLADDLRRFIEDEPIRARRTSSSERFIRWCRRNPGLAWAVGAVAAALVALTALSMLYATEQIRATQRIGALASDLKKERQSLRNSLTQSNRRLAIQHFERGLAAFEKGEVDAGLLWTLESWRSAIAANDLSWQRAARASLSAWLPRQPRLRGLYSHDRPIVNVAISPDGKTVASASEDNTARLWNAATGQLIARLDHPPVRGLFVNSVAFQPDGKAVVTGKDAVRFWDTATGQANGSPLPFPEGISCLAFTPDGARLVTCGWTGKIAIWDIATLRLQSEPKQLSEGILVVAVSPDGKIILTGNECGRVRLRNAANGEPVGEPLELRYRTWALAFSPDGKTFVTGFPNGEVRFWNTATMAPLGEPLQAHRAEIRGLAFSPDGRLILTGSADRTARLWDVATRSPVSPIFRHQGPIEGVAFGADGKSIVTGGGDYTARLWDTSIDPPADFLVNDKYEVSVTASFRHDGQGILLAGGHDARLLDATTGRILIPKMSQPANVWCAAMSPDGRLILTGGKDNVSQLWDGTTGKPLGAPLRCHSDAVSVVAFSPDGQTFLTGSQDHTCCLWETATQTRRGSLLEIGGQVDAAAFSPDGSILLIGTSHAEVQLWDVATGKRLGPPLPHSGAVSAVAFRPDGKVFAVAGEDGTARLWDTAARTPVGKPMTQQAWIFAVAFSPDGNTILTGGKSMSAQLWDAATQMPIGPTFPCPKFVTSVGFSPDGKRIVISGGGPFVRVCLTPIELPDDIARVSNEVESRTGLRLGPEGVAQALDNAAWLERRDASAAWRSGARSPGVPSALR